MSRPTPRFLLLSLVGLIAVAVAFKVLRPAADRFEHPNVLFIAIDDLNDWIGPLGGHPQSSTPSLERLAAQGVLFTNAHVPATVCNASRAAIMTGIPPHVSGIRTNNQDWRRLIPDAVTIPQHFAAAGYAVKGSGKIFHEAFPDPESWDDYFPAKDKQTPRGANSGRWGRYHAPIKGRFSWGPLDVPAEEMSDSVVASWIVEQLSREHDGPLFLAAGLSAPHIPWIQPSEYFDLYPPESIELPTVKADDLEDIPAIGRGNDRDHRTLVESDQWESAVRGYLASVAFADDVVGRIIAGLEAGPLADNTIVVLWSDHGWHLGEKRRWRKSTLWEETTRVPFIVVVPPGTAALLTGTPQGARIASAVSLLDIYPTLIELCGLPPRPGIDGQSLVPLLSDPRRELDRTAVLTTDLYGSHALRSRHHRYIRYRDGSEELYDHREDPHEWHNLAGRGEFAAIKQQLAAQLPTEQRGSARWIRVVR